MHSEHSTRAVYVYGIISILWICVRAYTHTHTQLLLCELYYCYKCVPRCRFSVAVGQFYARTTKAQLRPPSFASGWMAHSSFFVFGSCHLRFYLAIFIPQPCARVNSEAAPMNVLNKISIYERRSRGGILFPRKPRRDREKWNMNCYCTFALLVMSV